MKARRNLMIKTPIIVYELDPGDRVTCYVCQESRDEYQHRSYTRGEAYLAGPDHYPRNAEANYICKAHLDPEAVIEDVTMIGRPAAIPVFESVEELAEHLINQDGGGQ